MTTAAPYTGGDDLDDGLDVAPEYIAATTADAPASEAGDAQGFFSDDEDEPRASESDEREEDDSAQVGEKRKATAAGEGAPLTDAEKKKKRKTQAKERREKVGKLFPPHHPV
jgi:hypothetical protein